MTAAHARTSCCRDRAAAAHHDQLLTVDVDSEALLALLEMAVTWHELDYSECDVIGPLAWATFAENHRFTHPERAERAFSLALDIVGRGVAAPPPEPSLARVIDLVRG
jgi:hypothetical protein